MGNNSSGVAGHLLRYCSFQEATERIGRAFYPSSWNQHHSSFCSCILSGSHFGIEGTVQGVRYIDTGKTMRICNDSEIQDTLKEVKKPWDEKTKQMKAHSLNVQVQYARLVNDSDESLPLVESRGVIETFDMQCPLQRLALRDLLMFSNVQRILKECIFCDQSIRIYGINSKTEVAIDERMKETLSFEDDDFLWDMLILRSSYIHGTDFKDKQGTMIIEEKVALNRLDLQSQINSYLYSPDLNTLEIDKLFASFNGSDDDSNSSTLKVLLENIKQMPSVDKPPLEQVLEQIYSDYTTFSLELKPVEVLYAKAKTEIAPTEIARLSKQALVMRVTKFVENLGFVVREQHKVNETLEQDPSLKGKILLKNDPEAIATLLFSAERKMGGPTPTPGMTNERLKKQARKKKS